MGSLLRTPFSFWHWQQPFLKITTRFTSIKNRKEKESKPILQWRWLLIQWVWSKNRLLQTKEEAGCIRSIKVTYFTYPTYVHDGAIELSPEWMLGTTQITFLCCWTPLLPSQVHSFLLVLRVQSQTVCCADMTGEHRRMLWGKATNKVFYRIVQLQHCKSSPITALCSQCMRSLAAREVMIIIMCSFLCHFSFGAQGPLHETK